jgi:single-strand DNA-binding protein
MLRVSLLGNLGADPETRFSSKGTQITQFRVAVNQVRTGPDGERQENTEWFRVRVSGPRADFAKQLSKGNRVLVIGRLDISHYQSRDGEPRTGFDVWADELQSMSTRGFASEQESAYGGEAESAEPALAGVSSLSKASANGRGRVQRQDASSAAQTATAEELEDLPF